MFKIFFYNLLFFILLVSFVQGNREDPNVTNDWGISKTEEDNNVSEKDAVFGITASSSTPFVLGALKKAKKEKALTGLLVCNKPPQLSYIDHIISIIVGPEIITGATLMKAGTATKMILNMISRVQD